MTDDRVAATMARPDHAARPVVEQALIELVARARGLVSTGRRQILGISGTPGAGKSTLCAALLDSLGSDAVLVGMDGFHLAGQELTRLGRTERKGAFDTFDVDGYVALLRRLRRQHEDVIYAPTFDRGLEEPIGSAVAVSATTPLVITEGNYLLLEHGGWGDVRGCLDEVWFLDIDPQLREQRLLRRRQSFGHSVVAAKDWVTQVDERNAAVVEGTRARADLAVHLHSRLRATAGSPVAGPAPPPPVTRTRTSAPVPSPQPSPPPHPKEH